MRKRNDPNYTRKDLKDAVSDWKYGRLCVWYILIRFKEAEETIANIWSKNQICKYYVKQNWSWMLPKKNITCVETQNKSK